MGSVEAKLGTVVDGKYELEALLGQGGMGAVYRARHRMTGRLVAIKWLLENDESRRRRFLREARAMGRLSHPNVVQVYDVSEHEGEIFLVMEHLEGKMLRECIPPDGMEPGDAIELLLPAFAGVAAAHQAGILHRDLKPENLFVCCDRDGTPYDTKVLDFGLAKAVEADAESKLTQSGAIVGTPRYMSPEQLEESTVDERADIYALGLILYECLVGRLPHKSKSLNALLLEILTADHVAPHELEPRVPEALSAIVSRSIQRDPKDRQETVIELAQALEVFSDATFEVPREAHLTPENLQGMRPSLDADQVSSTIRARSSTSGDAGGTTRSDRPAARRGNSSGVEAFAPTAAVSTQDLHPAKRSWRIPALGIAIAIAAVGIAAFVLAPGDEAPTTEPEASTVAEPELPAEPEPAAVELPDPEPIANPEPSAVDPPVAEPEVTPEPEPEATPTHRRRRGTRHRTATEAEASAPTPEATPEEERLRVRSRAGVLQADDF